MSGLGYRPEAGAAFSVGGGPDDQLRLGAITTVLGLPAAWTDGGFFIAEQPMAPRILVPPHVHRHEDQVAYVISGRLGFRVGDVEVELEAGQFIRRGRGVPHTNWNPTDEPATMLEITFPGHLETYFRGLDALTRSGEATQEQVRALAADYGITFVDDWVEDLSARHSVRLAGGLWEDDRS